MSYKIDYIATFKSEYGTRTDAIVRWHGRENRVFFETRRGYPIETPIGKVALEFDGKEWNATHIATGLSLVHEDARRHSEETKNLASIVKYCKSVSTEFSEQEKEDMKIVEKCIEQYKEKMDEEIVEAKEGKWIKVPSATLQGVYFYDCSRCKFSVGRQRNEGLYGMIEWGTEVFCPHCGSRNKAEEG